MKKTILTTLIFLFAVGGLFAVTLDELNSTFLNLEMSIPREHPLESINFTLDDLEGVEWSLEDYRGKVVFLNFWATWCYPCRLEMPSMQRIYDEYKDDGLVILAVNQGERNNTVEKFIEDNEYTFPVLMDSSQMVGTMYGVRGIPTSYLIDREGNIMSMLVGTKEWDTPELRQMFEDLLAY